MLIIARVIATVSKNVFCVPSDPKDPIAIERLNLMNMAKLSIKGLIESALNLGRTLDSDYAPLQQFFVVMEHCLKHGLKSTYVTQYCLFRADCQNLPCIYFNTCWKQGCEKLMFIVKSILF